MAALNSAERSACETDDWSLSRARAASTASEADKDLAFPLLDLDAAQPRARLAGVAPRADVVLVAVPGADDVQLVGEVVAEAALLVVETLDDPVHQHALADRPAGVRAAVLPGVEPAVQAEDPDFRAVHVDDHPATLQNVLRQCDDDRCLHGNNLGTQRPGVKLNSGKIRSSVKTPAGTPIALVSRYDRSA